MDILDIIFQVLTIIILAAYTVLLYKSRLNPKVIKFAAGIITLAGTVLFIYGYRLEGYQGGVVSMFLRGFVSSVKMFIYDNSIFESIAAQKQSPYFIDLFILVYYAAILTSVSAIIMLFGKRVITFFALTFGRKKFRHIFFGVNKKSEMIARGIKDEEIAFIEFPGDDDRENISFSSISGSKSSDERGGNILSSKHVTLLRAKRKLAQRDTDEGVLEQIGLGRLMKRIDSGTSFYLLSDNGGKNLQDLLILMSDEGLRHITTHACVKREGLAGSYHGVLGKTGAHLIYPSSLSVVDLMRSPDCHPVNEMDVNGDGTVSGEFNAMVIGFGETGQASVKFIYEFASAIRKDGTPLPIKIHIVDEKAESNKGHFMFTCPEIEHDSLLCYDNIGLDSGEFWKFITSNLDSLNYVEISLGNDTANLNLACTIYGYAEKKRKDGFKHFRIFVRKRVTPQYEKRLVQRLNEKAGMEVIRCFGEDEKIFTPELIVSKNSSGINKSATSLADRLSARYEELIGNSGSQESAFAANSFHESRRRRKDMHQFISRANHISTKLAMAGWDTDLSKETLENLAMCEHLRYSRYLKAHGYSYDTEDDDVMKTNHQLCGWSQLTEEERQYHRDMVTASLSIS